MPALDEVAAAMPYEPGPKVISRDDHGDPVYEDVGLTPRFVELTRKHQKEPRGLLTLPCSRRRYSKRCRCASKNGNVRRWWRTSPMEWALGA